MPEYYIGSEAIEPGKPYYLTWFQVNKDKFYSDLNKSLKSQDGRCFQIIDKHFSFKIRTKFKGVHHSKQY